MNTIIQKTQSLLKIAKAAEAVGNYRTADLYIKSVIRIAQQVPAAPISGTDTELRQYVDGMRQVFNNEITVLKTQLQQLKQQIDKNQLLPQNNVPMASGTTPVPGANTINTVPGVATTMNVLPNSAGTMHIVE